MFEESWLFGELRCFRKRPDDLLTLRLFEQVHRKFLEPTQSFPVVHGADVLAAGGVNLLLGISKAVAQLF